MADDAPDSNLPDIDYKAKLQASAPGTVERMKAIIHVVAAPMTVLNAQNFSEAYIGELLDDLRNLVASIEMTTEFHSAGGLVPLLNCLRTFDAALRAKAANVLSTLMWGDSRSQKLVMEANGFNILFDVLTSDPDVVTRTKALDAIFALIRNNAPVISTFRGANGYEALKDPLTSEDLNYQSKALDLIHLILEEDYGESKIMHEQGYPRIMAILGNSEDAKIRETALWGLLKLGRSMEDMNDNIKNEFGDAMKPLLKERIGHMKSMSDEQFEASSAERAIVDKLWTICFDEPSCLWDEDLQRVLSEFERERLCGPPVNLLDIEQVSLSENSDSTGSTV